MTSHAHDPILAGRDLHAVAPIGVIYPVQSAPSAVYTFVEKGRHAGHLSSDIAAVVFTGNTGARLTYGHLTALLLERDRLLKRLDEVCPDHETCRACGTALCLECEIGDRSCCEHDMGPLCVGCDVEACAECRREARPFTFGGV